MKQHNDRILVGRKAGILNQAIRRPHKDRRVLSSVLFSFSMLAFKRWDGLVLKCLDPSSIYRLNLRLSGCLLVVFGFGKFY